MESVRQRQYASLEDNLAVIAQAVQAGVDLRTTPLALTLPLEFARLADILRQAGTEVTLTGTGLATVGEFYALFQRRRAELQGAMEKIFADKRAVMRVENGRVLTADQLWRTVEFIGEAARTVLTISTQIELDSPAQHPIPSVGEVSAWIGPVRR
ncbi:MAG: hypothetical protein H7330_16200 [Hymenobacteraceae bacterium]|nr:hypothetical protein [Hymenobacteraceae bacterium]